jgi:hypothetical protein
LTPHSSLTSPIVKYRFAGMGGSVFSIEINGIG